MGSEMCIRDSTHTGTRMAVGIVAMMHISAACCSSLMCHQIGRQTEYFRMMMEANRKNGIKVIAFKDIQTDEFRDKLLAAALEFDMKVKDAPEKVNVNAPYLKTLPNQVKIKLGIYNGDITLTKSAEQIKENIQRKQRPEHEKEQKEPGKPMLALPAHIPPRERD